jgi:asparagine synthase (glutamine-hydrolysing)
VMFKPTPPANDLFRPEFLEDVRRAEQAYAAIRRVHPVTFAAFRQSPWYHHGILGLEQTQLTVRSPYLDNNFVKAVYRAPASGNANGNGNGSHNGDSDVRLRLIADGSAALRRIPSDRGIGGNSGPLTSAIAHNFLEFTFKAEYAYDYGMPQWVARVDHMFSPLRLERLFLGRHKFLHYRVWYRDRLANYVKEMLLDPRTLSRPYLQRSSLEKIVSGHLKGDRNYTTAIHKMLTMELLHRLFFDSQAS